MIEKKDNEEVRIHGTYNKGEDNFYLEQKENTIYDLFLPVLPD